jgi:hypothetical protein
VQAAHHILGRRGPDTDLKRWGFQLLARGCKNAKKRALVAVARKLAVLHGLWVRAAKYTGDYVTARLARQPHRKAQLEIWFIRKSRFRVTARFRLNELSFSTRASVRN